MLEEHAPAPESSGWASDSLARAFWELEPQFLVTHPESSAWPMLKALLDAIEDADCALEAIRLVQTTESDQ